MPYKITLFDSEIDCVGSGLMSLDYVAFQLQMANGDDVEVDISSCGGSHFDAVAIYDLLKKYAGNVTTICVSVAGSAAATIFAAGSKRIMSKYGLLMIHPASTITGGDSKSIISDADMLDKCTGNVIAIWADVTGLDIDKITSMVNETTWLNAEEALALNFCTDVEDYTDADAEIVTNASVVLNRIQNAPSKYKQVVNHILVKQPEQAQPENNMTDQEIKDLVNGNQSVLDKVLNVLKLSTHEKVSNKGSFFFVGNLQKGTKVFNSATLDAVLNDDDIEVEDSVSAKKVKMSVKNGVIENMEVLNEAKTDEEDDMDDEDLDAENKVENVKTVLNTYGIQTKKSIGVKKVMNLTIKKLAEVTNQSLQKDATILELRNQLNVSNAAVKLTEDEVKDKIMSRFKPDNSHRDSRSTEVESVPNIKKPAEGSVASKAAAMAVKNHAAKV